MILWIHHFVKILTFLNITAGDIFFFFYLIISPRIIYIIIIHQQITTFQKLKPKKIGFIFTENEIKKCCRLIFCIFQTSNSKFRKLVLYVSAVFIRLNIPFLWIQRWNFQFIYLALTYNGTLLIIRKLLLGPYIILNVFFGMLENTLWQGINSSFYPIPLTG